MARTQKELDEWNAPSMERIRREYAESMAQRQEAHYYHGQDFYPVGDRHNDRPTNTSYPERKAQEQWDALTAEEKRDHEPDAGREIRK